MIAQSWRFNIAIDFDFFPLRIWLVLTLSWNEFALVLKINAPDIVHVSYLNVSASINKQFVVINETAVISSSLRLYVLRAELPPV